MLNIQNGNPAIIGPAQPRKGIDQMHGSTGQQLGNVPLDGKIPYSSNLVKQQLHGNGTSHFGGSSGPVYPNPNMPPITDNNLNNYGQVQNSPTLSLGGANGPVGQTPGMPPVSSQNIGQNQQLPYAGQYQNTGNYSPNNNSMALPEGVPQTGVIGAEQAWYGGLYDGLGALNAGNNQAMSGINSNINRGVSGFQPYISQGKAANSQQAALSGALGQEAQQAAYDAFLASPGQEWLQEQGERAVTRNAAALGGLGGGQVLQELQRQGQGLAAQDFDNSFNRLGSLSDRGMQGSLGAANLYGQGANLTAQLGMNTGQQAANMYQNTSSMVGQNRMDAGRDIANATQGTTSSLADLINQQGSGVSDLTGSNGSLLGGLIGANGEINAQAMQELSQYLSGQGIDGASLWGGQSIGGGESQGTAQNWGNLISAAAAAYGAYSG